MDSSRRIAIITGASSGLGLTFADAFASRGHDVVLVARNATRLEQGAQRIASRFHVAARALPLDLTKPDAWGQLAEREPRADVLVNNAGFASFGDLIDTDPDRLTNQIMLNCAALTALTRAYLPSMVQRDSGVVINIASTAAFQPIPAMAVYAATKAYVASFTAAVWAEVRATRVRILGVCPGPTQTAFFSVGGDDSVAPTRRSPDQVVDTAFAALASKRPLVVDGRPNAMLAAISRFAPTRLQTFGARLATRPHNR